MKWRTLSAVMVVCMVLCLSASSIASDDPIEARISQVLQMSPYDMAVTSKTVVKSYNSLVEAAESIGNPEYKQVVMGMLKNPSPSFLGVAPLDYRSFLSASGAGAHHMYPGGLPVHTYVNLTHAMNILNTYQDIYGAEFDRDLVISAVILHDVVKAYTNQYFPEYNQATGKWAVPKEVASDGLFKAWGRYGLMGHHNEMIIPELAFREAPAILVATSHSHQDQYWDSRSNSWLQEKDETWERTMEDGLNKLGQVTGRNDIVDNYKAEVIKPEYKTIEAGINLLSDSDWNMSQGKAGVWAQEIFAAFAAKHGLAAGTADYNLVQGWLFSRVDPTRLAAEYEKVGKDIDATVQFVESVFIDPSQFETSPDQVKPLE